MPSSESTATTEGRIPSPGCEPAERTWTRPPARYRVRAAAIWDRPELWTHTYSTSGTGFGMNPRDWARAVSRLRANFSASDAKWVETVAVLARAGYEIARASCRERVCKSG